MGAFARDRRSKRIVATFTGFEADVAHLARDSRLDYGLGVAFLAIVVGTLAGLIFRRS